MALLELMMWGDDFLLHEGEFILNEGDTSNCCCPGGACCCAQFTSPNIPPANLTVTIYEAGTTNVWCTFQIPVFSSADCIQYRKIGQTGCFPCFAGLTINLTLVCEGTSPSAFTLAIVSGSSGCIISPSAAVGVNSQTATCNPLFLKFEGYTISNDPTVFPVVCGTCDGLAFDVEITA